MKGKIIDEGSLEFKSDQLEKRVEFQDAEIHKLKVCKLGLEKLIEEGKEVRNKELKTLKDKYEENLIYVNRKKGDLGRETIILNEAYKIITNNNNCHKLTSYNQMRSVHTAIFGIQNLFASGKSNKEHSIGPLDTEISALSEFVTIEEYDGMILRHEEELAGSKKEIEKVEKEINVLIEQNKIELMNIKAEKNKTIRAYRGSNEELLSKSSTKNTALMICGCLIATLVVVIINLVVRG